MQGRDISQMSHQEDGQQHILDFLIQLRFGDIHPP